MTARVTTSMIGALAARSRNFPPLGEGRRPHERSSGVAASSPLWFVTPMARVGLLPKHGSLR